MSISTTKRRNEEVNVGLSERRKAEITAPKFDLFGETYTFVETFSGTVIDSNPSKNQIWVKTDDGDEKQISAYGIAFRNSHRIRLYELRKYSNDNLCVVYADALIVNLNTGEYKLNLNKKTVIIPAFLTMLFHNASTASYYRAMPVSKLFSIIFILLCAAALISFLTLPWGFKDGYVWDEHKYMWFTYFLSRIGSFVCIKWIKRRSERFDHELRNLIDLLKS
ncbi:MULTISPECIES: hypothetical protein [Enterobacter cloacae complex]|jgi:hypothetical protein|uniref:hypothetical protein n=1 Tax=Enterobacter cloacae complex TaxID=354276 RepID=UPI0004500F72|nr:MULTISPECIES: hypothetical protein [Enterobacter cloacae complex]EFE7951179.1 hypothetical protein [Escherichia coli]EIV9095214.1 hypothetical protein [Escherichia coli]ELM8898453.1 hypothetical protein [Escherichia coli]EMC9518636.1 hypothetical protein [Escherichia coli]EUM21729.1 hypothetical protein L463_01726 [Enterobacter sp. BIDMC 27]